jgi:hypothetical protein
MHVALTKRDKTCVQEIGEQEADDNRKEKSILF